MGSRLELVFQQAWNGLRRHGLVAFGAICNIGVSLCIVAGFFLMATNLEHLASGLASEAVITVQLADDADGDAVQRALYGDTRVKDTKFISKDEALKAYAKTVNIPYKDLKGAITNPLPDVVQVSVVQPEDLPAVAEKAKTVEGVEKVRYRRDIADKLIRVARGVRLAGLGLGALMALAALLLVSTTIQMGVHSRRREIRIMQLVGATNNFIRAPFIIEGAAQGLLGGLLAAIMVLTGYLYLYGRVSANLKFVEMLHSGQFLTLVGVGTLLLGVVLGILGSLIGTRRYLRLV